MPYREKYEWGPFVWGLIHTVTIIDNLLMIFMHNNISQARALYYASLLIVEARLASMDRPYR
jgi:hypothetical protein